MKKILLTAIVAILGLNVHSQILTPVKWSYAAKKTGNNDAVVFIKATIDKGWHIYSQNIADGGPAKTEFTFNASPAYSLNGVTAEPKPISKYEKSFSMNVSYFEGTVIFQQKIKLKDAQAAISGTVKFMVCNDKQCLPPDDVEFNIAVK
ncbi:protein-disulfide reductase DsbD domain-containing protein [Mucilaginibacter sp. SP1R1]|uniref:protein-disulfide reductase DsbD domain-containing protein n=1 Tax=Mucilaginibacter sp. SP1R1 TaxID=2723091 RepID=UPI00161514BB|nr:protein-disulfide reductase DsbD domain-containing protein [Mucilaginibacter sp. SP1R1]MBB6149014.1 DsbC/DsbD-like thiol-disulfide interchange protein [Mucilaginibacter sp. SP1R1]